PGGWSRYARRVGGNELLRLLRRNRGLLVIPVMLRGDRPGALPRAMLSQPFGLKTRGALGSRPGFDMAHRRLFPKPGSGALSSSDIIDRLRAEFRHVEVDHRQGIENAERMIAQLERMRQLSPAPASDDEIERLTRLREQAVFVVVSDNPEEADAYL